MPKFKVLVTETMQKTVVIEAKNAHEARTRVSDAWQNTEFILEPEDCFQGVDFRVIGTLEGDERPYLRHVRQGEQPC